jgi:hypothetical protein
MTTIRLLYELFNDESHTLPTYSYSIANIVNTAVFAYISGKLGKLYNDPDKAAKHGYLWLVHDLHERGIYCTYKGMFNAIEYNNLDIVRYLFENGFRDRVFDAFSHDYANLAAEKGHLDILMYLRNSQKTNCTREGAYSAIICDHLHIIKYLGECGAVILTPLAYFNAVNWGHCDILRYLYENKHLFEIKYETEYCKKMGKPSSDMANLATILGHLDILMYLVEIGVPCDIRIKNNASFHRHHNIVEYLTKIGI